MSVSSGSRIWLRRGGGGGGLREGRHIDNECMRSQGRIRKAGGEGGGGVLSVLGPIRKVGRGGEGCLPYDDLYLGL